MNRKRIKKSARKEKKIFICKHLELGFHGTTIQQWDHIRSIKLVSKSARADTFADYLADKVWHSEQDLPVPVTAPSLQIQDMNSPFTVHELNLALRKIKSAKAPGPNGLVGKLYKHAPYILRMYFLDHYNQYFATKEVPSSWDLRGLFGSCYDSAELPKGHSFFFQSPSHFLDHISYKIFASMIQARLSRHLDSRIRPTQFGFRKSRSTTQLIHILRRLLEVHGRQPSPLHALFLDWSRAFDSILLHLFQSSLLCSSSESASMFWKWLCPFIELPPL